MLAFQFNPTEGAVCPICGKNEVKDATNIPVIKPGSDFEFVKTIQVHVECVVDGLALLSNCSTAVIGKTAPYYKDDESET